MNRSNIVPGISVQIRRQLIPREEQRDQVQDWRQFLNPRLDVAVTADEAADSTDPVDGSMLDLCDANRREDRVDERPIQPPDGGYLGDLSEPLIDEGTSIDRWYNQVFRPY